MFFADDGGGMDPEQIRKCMSLGYSSKKSKTTIGQCNYFDLVASPPPPSLSLFPQPELKKLICIIDCLICLCSTCFFGQNHGSSL